MANEVTVTVTYFVPYSRGNSGRGVNLTTHSI